MQYLHHYINCSRDELLNDTEKQMKKSRFEHILRVEETAIKLAETHNYMDLEKVSIAAILHDFAKEMDQDEMLVFAQDVWPHPQLGLASDGVWHGFAAARIAQEKFDCTDQSILNAIAGHTTGWFEMDTLAQIIYIADYIEPNRDFPGVEKARNLAKDNLEKATNYKMKSTIEHLVNKENYLFPGTIDIYNEWIKNTKK